MSKSTPGPWTVDDGMQAQKQEPTYAIRQFLARCVDAVDNPEKESLMFDESAANAALISAAPDLLEAAKWAVGFATVEMIKLEQGSLEPALKKIYMDGWNRIRKQGADAIKKAEGTNE